MRGRSDRRPARRQPAGKRSREIYRNHGVRAAHPFTPRVSVRVDDENRQQGREHHDPGLRSARAAGADPHWIAAARDSLRRDQPNDRLRRGGQTDAPGTRLVSRMHGRGYLSHRDARTLRRRQGRLRRGVHQRDDGSRSPTRRAVPVARPSRSSGARVPRRNGRMSSRSR
jgi:hypothetical protein